MGSWILPRVDPLKGALWFPHQFESLIFFISDYQRSSAVPSESSGEFTWVDFPVAGAGTVP
jgi:hypothetical protein